MFPLGRLREPFSALLRAHMVVLMGADASVPPGALPFLTGKPMFRCSVVPKTLVGLPGIDSPKDLAGETVVLFSGIADPGRFRKVAHGLGWRVKDHMVFPDHHAFEEKDIRAVNQRAAGVPCVCTEKDWVKLPRPLRLSGKFGALGIGVEPDDEEALWKAVSERLSCNADAGDIKT
jgi:tetraacyldisaccharide 4'-kinase